MTKNRLVKLIYMSFINDMFFKYTQEELIKKDKKQLEYILEDIREKAYDYMLKED